MRFGRSPGPFPFLHGCRISTEACNSGTVPPAVSLGFVGFLAEAARVIPSEINASVSQVMAMACLFNRVYGKYFPEKKDNSRTHIFVI